MWLGSGAQTDRSGPVRALPRRDEVGILLANAFLAREESVPVFNSRYISKAGSGTLAHLSIGRRRSALVAVTKVARGHKSVSGTSGMSGVP